MLGVSLEGMSAQLVRGVTALSLVLDFALESMPSVSFSQRLTRFLTKKASMKKKLAERAIAIDHELAKQMQIDGRCLFVRTHGNNQDLTPQHLSMGRVVNKFFDGALFAKMINSSVDLEGLDSIFLNSCYGLSHMETIVQETGLRVFASDNLMGEESKPNSLKTESVSITTEAFRELIIEVSSLYPNGGTQAEMSELLKTLPVPEAAKKNPDILVRCLSPDSFPEFYGNLMECSPGEKPKIVSSREFPMITRQGVNHDPKHFDNTFEFGSFSDQLPGSRKINPRYTRAKNRSCSRTGLKPRKRTAS